jgi:hypothetical protein
VRRLNESMLVVGLKGSVLAMVTVVVTAELDPDERSVFTKDAKHLDHHHLLSLTPTAAGNRGETVAGWACSVGLDCGSDCHRDCSVGRNHSLHDPSCPAGWSIYSICSSRAGGSDSGRRPRATATHRRRCQAR